MHVFKNNNLKHKIMTLTTMSVLKGSTNLITITTTGPIELTVIMVIKSFSTFTTVVIPVRLKKKKSKYTYIVAVQKIHINISISIVLNKFTSMLNNYKLKNRYCLKQICMFSRTILSPQLDL
jgi:hypothetical protein